MNDAASGTSEDGDENSRDGWRAALAGPRTSASSSDEIIRVAEE